MLITRQLTMMHPQWVKTLSSDASVVSWPPWAVWAPVNPVAALSARAPRCHSRPAWSTKRLTSAETSPNRVGVAAAEAVGTLQVLELREGPARLCFPWSCGRRWRCAPCDALSGRGGPGVRALPASMVRGRRLSMTRAA
jgi:hypothetical protein